MSWHRLVLVGDSIVAVVPGGNAASGLPAHLQSTLREWIVWTYARGFWTVGLDWYLPDHYGGRASPDPEAIRALLVPGDAVVVFLGSNDFALSRPLEETRSGYERLLGRVLDADTIIAQPGPTVPVCVTPIWRRDGSRPNGLGLALSDYADAIREICTKRRIPVIDGFDLLRSGEKGVLEDGVHPNVEGARILGLRLGERLGPILSRSGEPAR